MLKKLVYQVNPDIDSVTGKVMIGSARYFGKLLEEAWALINEEMLKSLVDSMKRRIEACNPVKRMLYEILKIYFSAQCACYNVCNYRRKFQDIKITT